MPYRIRKQPNKPTYKVYSESGTPLSNKGLSFDRAKKQLTAVNIQYAIKKRGKR